MKLDRRIRCRHFNAFLPKLTPRIYITNSSEEDFYPTMKKQDATGVRRRQLFVNVTHDVRSGVAPAHCLGSTMLPVSPEATGSLRGPTVAATLAQAIRQSLSDAHLGHCEEGVLGWCDKMGVAIMAEVAENCSDLAMALGLKPLEHRRLEKALSQHTPAERVDEVVPALQGTQEREDEFGPDGWFD